MSSVSFTVRSDMEKAAAELGPTMAKQVRFAAALALTRVGQAIQEAQTREMRDVFDRPTPFTLRSLRLMRATRDQLRARVWLKEDGSQRLRERHFLWPVIRGGERPIKRFERMLRAAGILPSGMFAVPGQGARLDAFGNMERGQLVQVLAWFRTFATAGYSANMNDKGRARLGKTTKKRQGFAYFAVTRPGGRLPPGIYQRFNMALGSAVKPVLIFVNAASYQRLYPFGYVADRVRAKQWPLEWPKALAEAKASAR